MVSPQLKARMHWLAANEEILDELHLFGGYYITTSRPPAPAPRTGSATCSCKRVQRSSACSVTGSSTRPSEGCWHAIRPLGDAHPSPWADAQARAARAPRMGGGSSRNSCRRLQRGPWQCRRRPALRSPANPAWTL